MSILTTAAKEPALKPYIVKEALAVGVIGVLHGARCEQALGAEVLEKSEAINSVEAKVAALKDEVVELEAEQAAKEPLVSPWASVVKLNVPRQGKDRVA